ncbi:hypothetical protein L218DRAFT_1005437 [Marasmius fiardii PR-910]|nr:hypothetical protein L218DRAFT_1005437 [Marasmius fiardii PR-910]
MPPAFTFPPDQLLQSLEMTSNIKLPPIPPSEPKEVFWRIYLLANQIILYLGARPPAEAEAFASVLESAIVPSESDIARGRSSLVRITGIIVDTMSFLPQTSEYRLKHPKVIKVIDNIQSLLEDYRRKTSKESEMERWSRFFNSLRTEVVELAMVLKDVVEGEEK